MLVEAGLLTAAAVLRLAPSRQGDDPDAAQRVVSLLGDLRDRSVEAVREPNGALSAALAQCRAASVVAGPPSAALNDLRGAAGPPGAAARRP